MNRRERRTKNKEINILREVITIINQYFPELTPSLENTQERIDNYEEANFSEKEREYYQEL